MDTTITVMYETQEQRAQLIADNADKRLVEEQNHIDGNYLVFSDNAKALYIKSLEDQILPMASHADGGDTIMVNPVVVRIAAERILSGGINPKTGEVYVLDNIANPEYRAVVEDYILVNTKGIYATA
ncbi:hypothetical protein [Cohnella sp.]|uniref:hypothetical protein n=1 Tax=Cohnella sp. TaxID=1883426 RepID=UPI00356885DB